MKSFQTAGWREIAVFNRSESLLFIWLHLSEVTYTKIVVCEANGQSDSAETLDHRIMRVPEIIML
jgi:hypothetical protein